MHKCFLLFFLQGTHPSLKANTNAKATVTAIIDGTGSMGAAFGPLLVGVISDSSVSIGIVSMIGCNEVLGLDPGI